MCHYAVLWSAFRVSGSRSLMSRSRRIRKARALPSVTDLFLSPLPRSMSTTRTVRSDCRASVPNCSSAIHDSELTAGWPQRRSFPAPSASLWPRAVRALPVLRAPAPWPSRVRPVRRPAVHHCAPQTRARRIYPRPLPVHASWELPLSRSRLLLPGTVATDRWRVADIAIFQDVFSGSVPPSSLVLATAAVPRYLMSPFRDLRRTPRAAIRIVPECPSAHSPQLSNRACFLRTRDAQSASRQS